MGTIRFRPFFSRHLLRPVDLAFRHLPTAPSSLTKGCSYTPQTGSIKAKLNTPKISTTCPRAFIICTSSPSKSSETRPTQGNLVSAISDIGIVALLFLIGYLLSGTTAGFAASGLYGACFIAVRWAPKGSTENPMTMLILLSLFLYLTAAFRFSKRSIPMSIAAGASAAAAVMIKQPAVFFLPTVVLHFTFLWVAKEQNKDRLKAIGMSFITGFVACLAVVARVACCKGTFGAGGIQRLYLPLYHAAGIRHALCRTLG